MNDFVLLVLSLICISPIILSLWGLWNAGNKTVTVRDYISHDTYDDDDDRDDMRNIARYLLIDDIFDGD